MFKIFIVDDRSDQRVKIVEILEALGNFHISEFPFPVHGFDKDTLTSEKVFAFDKVETFGLVRFLQQDGNNVPDIIIVDIDYSNNEILFPELITQTIDYDKAAGRQVIQFIFDNFKHTKVIYLTAQGNVAINELLKSTKENSEIHPIFIDKSNYDDLKIVLKEYDVFKSTARKYFKELNNHYSERARLKKFIEAEVMSDEDIAQFELKIGSKTFLLKDLLIGWKGEDVSLKEVVRGLLKETNREYKFDEKKLWQEGGIIYPHWNYYLENASREYENEIFFDAYNILLESLYWYRYDDKTSLVDDKSDNDFFTLSTNVILRLTLDKFNDKDIVGSDVSTNKLKKYLVGKKVLLGWQDYFEKVYHIEPDLSLITRLLIDGNNFDQVNIIIDENGKEYLNRPKAVNIKLAYDLVGLRKYQNEERLYGEFFPFDEEFLKVITQHIKISLETLKTFNDACNDKFLDKAKFGEWRIIRNFKSLLDALSGTSLVFEDNGLEQLNELFKDIFNEYLDDNKNSLRDSLLKAKFLKTVNSFSLKDNSTYRLLN